MAKLTEHQRVVLTISEHIRNDMENFHGGFMNGKHGFINDEQMKRLNICIRHSVDEILEAIMNPDKVMFTVRGIDITGKMQTQFALQNYDPKYMELPSSPELEKAYKEYVLGYEGES